MPLQLRWRRGWFPRCVFGPAGRLLRALASALRATYAFWQTLCGRMRTRGAYFLDARLVAIEFRFMGAREQAKDADD